MLLQLKTSLLGIISTKMSVASVEDQTFCGVQKTTYVKFQICTSFIEDSNFDFVASEMSYITLFVTKIS